MARYSTAPLGPLPALIRSSGGSTTAGECTTTKPPALSSSGTSASGARHVSTGQGITVSVPFCTFAPRIEQKSAGSMTRGLRRPGPIPESWSGHRTRLQDSAGDVRVSGRGPVPDITTRLLRRNSLARSFEKEVPPAHQPILRAQGAFANVEDGSYRLFRAGGDRCREEYDERHGARQGRHPHHLGPH